MNRKRKTHLGTFGLKDKHEIKLLAKLIMERYKGHHYYKSPLISDEETNRLW